MKAFLGILGHSWVFLSHLGPSLGVLEASWRRLGAVWGRLSAYSTGEPLEALHVE